MRWIKGRRQRGTYGRLGRSISIDKTAVARKTFNQTGRTGLTGNDQRGQGRQLLFLHGLNQGRRQGGVAYRMFLNKDRQSITGKPAIFCRENQGGTGPKSD